MVDQLITIGILIVFIGAVILTIGLILSTIKQRENEAEGGFIFFLGPFPIFGGAISKGVFMRF